MLIAADGQHADLSPSCPDTPEEYTALVDRKSASLTAAFCAAGARLASAREEIVDAYAEFGRHLGRRAQYLNDLHGMWPAEGNLKDDLKRRAYTLPAIFALRGPKDAARERLRRYLAREMDLSSEEERGLRDWLVACGAFHYTLLAAEASLHAAQAALRKARCPEESYGLMSEVLLEAKTRLGPRNDE